MARPAQQGKWQFWIDRGGTFTDVVALRPNGGVIARKYLSENPDQYDDAALHGIRDILGLKRTEALPDRRIAALKLGTTAATNALLERKGAKTALVATRGFGDALLIGDQRRPELFALGIAPPVKLFGAVIEAAERIDAQGKVIEQLDEARLRAGLQKLRKRGFRSLAIALVNAYLNPAHEEKIAELAQKAGFPHVTTSYRTAPVIKFGVRGATAVVDAYLSPVLEGYVNTLRKQTGRIPLFFMQSSGGLAEAAHFRGKDAILSGPAGGIVGAARAAGRDHITRIIGFDMGGTSTDVSHFDGAFERTAEAELEGIRLKVPMLKIHTVAAGGGSICRLSHGRFKVGPDSAGAKPGPACYRLGGPLTVTDCNLILGRIQPDLFPEVFGKNHNQPLDKQASLWRMEKVLKTLEREAGKKLTPEQAAEGFIAVAVEHMARAVKKISVQKGRDVRKYALVSFGGAGGQHACAVAEALGLETILVHPLAGVLSALGIGESGLQEVREKTVETSLDKEGVRKAHIALKALRREVEKSLGRQGAGKKEIKVAARLHLKYAGSDTAIPVAHGPAGKMRARFEKAHKALFGFAESNKPVAIQAAEILGATAPKAPRLDLAPKDGAVKPLGKRPCRIAGKTRRIPVYRRDALPAGKTVGGPAIIVEDHGTNLVAEGWRAEVSKTGNLILTRSQPKKRARISAARPDPILLEIFNHRFMAIAEEMGAVLEHTAHSVNIKERLDFSCALFDGGGELVANAPHMPVHLGSMSESVKMVAGRNQGKMGRGDAWLLNDPYHGGTHLPDLTVVVPVFLKPRGKRPDFYVASRGHHADIGGLSPGSMPPGSSRIEEEGVLFDNFRVMNRGRFRERALIRALEGAPYPSRNPAQNVADIKAQFAACRRGIASLAAMCAEFGEKPVKTYMRFIQDNAARAVRDVIGVLGNGKVAYPLDNGLKIKVGISVNRKRRVAKIDFSGTSKQTQGNFNAPKAVTVAAVLYTFRCLVGEEIPLNAGCLKPLTLEVPEGSFLNPRYPAAVVAGNVETSQAVTNALLLALGKLAASQGTMNNLAFGNRRFQYYETVAGGAGAGEGIKGASARQVHMTNSRLTDAEVLELRFPVRVEEFSIRRGSGGAGKWRGGDGATRKIRALEEMEMSILSSHREIPPPGLGGGSAGKRGKNGVMRASGKYEKLQGCDSAKLEKGDTIVIKTPGGGGFGKRKGKES